MHQAGVRARIDAIRPRLHPVRFIEYSSFRVYLAPMLMRKGHIRGTSRMLAGLFAMQMVLTGFCLLTADAHAMPAAQMSGMQADSMAAMCPKSDSHDKQHHSDNCFHCDDGDQFVKVGSVDIAPLSLVLVALSTLPEHHLEQSSTDSIVYYTPTGPPGSASLLYTTTQRIRV